MTWNASSRPCAAGRPRTGDCGAAFRGTVRARLRRRRRRCDARRAGGARAGRRDWRRSRLRAPAAPERPATARRTRVARARGRARVLREVGGQAIEFLFGFARVAGLQQGEGEVEVQFRFVGFGFDGLAQAHHLGVRIDGRGGGRFGFGIGASSLAAAGVMPWCWRNSRSWPSGKAPGKPSTSWPSFTR
jgi:hypothetical protein